MKDNTGQMNEMRLIYFQIRRTEAEKKTKMYDIIWNSLHAFKHHMHWYTLTTWCLIYLKHKHQIVFGPQCNTS